MENQEQLPSSDDTLLKIKYDKLLEHFIQLQKSNLELATTTAKIITFREQEIFALEKYIVYLQEYIGNDEDYKTYEEFIVKYVVKS